MAVSQRLELRQGQSLVMTPQLQQAIKLLQLSNIELAEFCEQELEKNPLLERDDSTPALEAEREPPPAEAVPAEALDKELAREDFSKCADMDATGEDRYSDGEERGATSAENAPLADWSTVRGSAQRYEGEEDLLESTVAEGGTLKDHLLEQLAIAAFDADKRFICVALIDAVDEAGYLRADLDEMAARLGCEKTLIEETLAVLQGFDPVGVAARDLAECLALQLKEKDRFDPAMAAMVAHLDLVARRDMSQLAQICGVDSADIADMLAEIRALSPKPGLKFTTEPVQPVVPDVIVREGPDGGWLVELNSETLPRLLVNARYFARVSAHARDKESKTYLTECLNNANWLVKSLDQRARTILKVASEIVRQQDGFLAYGVRHLRPLNLRTIADAIGMHESTVSRVTSNKYVATPRGLFELKYFFTAAIQSLDGSESHSAEAVRDRIREMIEREEPREILSDDRIVALLTADGVHIARRTVAKYRESMRIPSSVERRRLKAGESLNSGLR
ncbi:RNA polymerase factor sigma-54 [Rhizomicrobium electricum]|uniref:RNA polymerase sigma-54 factor n=1 Tax=Rhizomicrobium electricum TaxID=480070 RepID=A0ABN1ENK6_9PROT|nr:RNA polymerase factor sigma-54 [Rhizomicrobium electricum]NIJ46873.1 RNA polymerase sigma-54 factor [Rhizomicrobium electricum]